MASTARMSMSTDGFQAKATRAIGVAAIGLSLAGVPLPAMADGAVSASTVYRARNSYGARIVNLGEAANNGDFAAFAEKRAVNGFDLFISASNAQNGIKQKEMKKAELALEAQIYTAVKEKNAANLKKSYNDFIKVANLKSDYKPGELGQTDGSGYSPTWGTDRQYIYQR